MSYAGSAQKYFFVENVHHGLVTDNGFSFGQPKMYFTNKKSTARYHDDILVYTKIYIPRVNGPVKKIHKIILYPRPEFEKKLSIVVILRIKMFLYLRLLCV